MGSCDHAIALKPQKFSFKTRKAGLQKKIRELTTLCDAQACMIIFPPKQTQTSDHRHHDHVEIWPEKLEDFNKVITRYRKTSSSNKKQEEEKEDTAAVIKKQMQQNSNNNDNFNLEAYSREQLEAILQQLDFNIEIVKQKMNSSNPLPLLCSSEYDCIKQTMNPIDPMPFLCSSEYDDYVNQKMNPIDPPPLVCSTDYVGDYYYEYGNFYFSAGSLDDSTAMGSSESLANFIC